MFAKRIPQKGFIKTCVFPTTEYDRNSREIYEDISRNFLSFDKGLVAFFHFLSKNAFGFPKVYKIVKNLQFYDWKFVEIFVVKTIAFYGKIW